MINKVARPFLLVATHCLKLIVSGCGVDGGGGSSTSTLHPIDRTDPPENEGNTGDVFFTFVEDAGLDRQFNTAISEMTDMAEFFSGGLAAADYDADGDVDLYVAGGKSEPNHLFENQGDGKFIDVANSRGVDLLHWGSGPAFSDVDGDGDLDLFIGAVEGEPYYLLENREGNYIDVTDASGVVIDADNTVSATFFDYDSEDQFPKTDNSPHV